MTDLFSSPSTVHHPPSTLHFSFDCFLRWLRFVYRKKQGNKDLTVRELVSWSASRSMPFRRPEEDSLRAARCSSNTARASRILLLSSFFSRFTELFSRFELDSTGSTLSPVFDDFSLFRDDFDDLWELFSFRSDFSLFVRPFFRSRSFSGAGLGALLPDSSTSLFFRLSRFLESRRCSGEGVAVRLDFDSLLLDSLSFLDERDDLCDRFSPWLRSSCRFSRSSSPLSSRWTCSRKTPSSSTDDFFLSDRRLAAESRFSLDALRVRFSRVDFDEGFRSFREERDDFSFLDFSFRESPPSKNKNFEKLSKKIPETFQNFPKFKKKHAGISNRQFLFEKI